MRILIRIHHHVLIRSGDRACQLSSAAIHKASAHWGSLLGSISHRVLLLLYHACSRFSFLRVPFLFSLLHFSFPHSFLPPPFLCHPRPCSSVLCSSRPFLLRSLLLTLTGLTTPHVPFPLHFLMVPKRCAVSISGVGSSSRCVTVRLRLSGRAFFYHPRHTEMDKADLVRQHRQPRHR